ncbi:unnamed protein product [Sphagnum jensenii]
MNTIFAFVIAICTVNSLAVDNVPPTNQLLIKELVINVEDKFNSYVKIVSELEKTLNGLPAACRLNDTNTTSSVDDYLMRTASESVFTSGLAATIQTMLNETVDQIYSAFTPDNLACTLYSVYVPLKTTLKLPELDSFMPLSDLIEDFFTSLEVYVTDLVHELNLMLIRSSLACKGGRDRAEIYSNILSLDRNVQLIVKYYRAKINPHCLDLDLEKLFQDAAPTKEGRLNEQANKVLKEYLDMYHLLINGDEYKHNINIYSLISQIKIKKMQLLKLVNVSSNACSGDESSSVQCRALKSFSFPLDVGSVLSARKQAVKQKLWDMARQLADVADSVDVEQRCSMLTAIYHEAALFIRFAGDVKPAMRVVEDVRAQSLLDKCPCDTECTEVAELINAGMDDSRLPGRY